MATAARAIRRRALHEAAVAVSGLLRNEMECSSLTDKVAAYEDDD